MTLPSRYIPRRAQRVMAAMSLLALPLLLALSACREVNGVVWSDFRSVASSGWDPAKPFSFDPFPADSALSGGRFDLCLCVRYYSRRPMPPIRVRAVCDDESGNVSCDTLTLDLFTSAGLPAGGARFSVAELRMPLRSDFRLTPGFGVDLYSLSPADDSLSLLDVGLLLCRHGADTGQ